VSGLELGRVLGTVYALFALAAGARSAVQIATRMDEAPLAYGLSALAAVVYLVLAVAIARPGPAARRIAIGACGVELCGVLAVGILDSARPDLFPDETVWSGFGAGYGYVPLVLPVGGLAWLFGAKPESLGPRTGRRGKLQHRIGRTAADHTGRRHLPAQLDHPPPGSHEDQIEGEAHSEGVDAAAAGDQQPLSRPLPIEERQAE
jgi:hypothetical protein